MNKDPKADLIYAILSMDSYNRGYGSGVTGISDAEGVSLGDWKIVQTADTLLVPGSAKPAGFYAIAYKNSVSGDVVISYRGTDKNISFDDEGSDFINGYGLALGLTPSSAGTKQAELAATFYENIAALNKASSISITGHSLGGGLAGYVGALTNSNAVVFDNMPFVLGAVNRANELGISARIDQIHGYYTEGEFLQKVRSGESISNLTEGLSIAAFGPILGPVIANSGVIGSNGFSLAQLIGVSEARIGKDPLDAHYVPFDPLSVKNELHSIVLLTSLLWNKAYGNSDWIPAGQQLWGAFFNSDVASRIPGIEARVGQSDVSGVMQSAIAYSAIPVGNDTSKPFGDTAIRAMFDDAGDLGAVINQFAPSKDIRHFIQSFANAAVQYAGTLAINDIESSTSDETYKNIPGSAKGILEYKEDTLFIDYSAKTWTLPTGGVVSDIVSKSGIIDLIQSSTYAPLTNILSDHWNTSLDFYAEKIAVGSRAFGVNVTLSEASATKGTLFFGTEESDTVFGSAQKDLLIANGGNGDFLQGLGGDDILIGDLGSDTLSGGDGNDYLYDSGGSDNVLIGGDGDDIYHLLSSPGTTRITDAGGKLYLGNQLIGKDFKVAAQDTLESGWAKQAEDGQSWMLDGYAIKKTGENGIDLTLEKSGQTIVLSGFVEGRYGIRLNPNALKEADVKVIDSFPKAPELLGYYLVVDPVTIKFSYQYLYTSEAAQKDASLINYAFVSLGNGASGTPYNQQDIAGTDDNDLVKVSTYAANGDQVISTGSGNDIIYSNRDHYSAQTVHAGADRDFIHAYGGKGSVFGDEGDDDIKLHAEFFSQPTLAAQTLVYGGAGRDTFHGVNAALVDGGSGIDHWEFFLPEQINGYWGADSDASLNARTGTFSVADLRIAGTVANIETFDVKTGAGNDTIVTGNGDDRVAAGKGINVIETGSGNDYIRLDAADNTLSSGAGDDLIDLIPTNYASGPNHSEIEAGDGNDTVNINVDATGRIPTNGTGRVDGGDGNDRITIFSVNDFDVLGGAGNDTITASAVTSRISGGAGNDAITAYAGADTIEGGAGDDTINGGSGVDTAIYSGAWTDYKLESSIEISPGRFLVPGPNDIFIRDLRGTDGLDRVSNVENFRFSNGTFAASAIVNFAPVASSDAATGVTALNKTVTGNLLANDKDANLATANLGETLSLKSAGSFAQAATSVAGATIIKGDYGVLTVGIDGGYSYTLGGGRYTASLTPGVKTSDYFSYTVADAHGLTANSSLNVEISGVAIPVNHAPEYFATPASLGDVDENRSFTVTRDQLLIGIFDADGDTLSIAGLTTDHGAVTANPDGSYTITPAANYSGTLNFAYSVSDGKGGVLNASRFANVLDVAPAPPPAPNSKGAVRLPDSVTEADYGGYGHALTAYASANGTAITGTAFGDKLYGAAGADTLTGGAGNDLLDGGTGADRLIGGIGNDSYRVDSIGDIIIELEDEGKDIITSSISLALPDNVENLRLTGTANLFAIGNDFNNGITGNDGDNDIRGGKGNDTLNGGLGADRMEGGAGNDIYVVDNADDLVIEQPDEGTDAVRATISYTLTANVENLTLAGTDDLNGTGNALNNRLTGNAGVNHLYGGDGNDVIDGGLGADFLEGGIGNDIYIVDDSADTVIELADEGTDTVRAAASYALSANIENLSLTGTGNIDATGNGLGNVLLGNSGDNTLTGNAGNDSLNGGAGADILIGGTGDDLYTVDEFDTVVEAISEGTDTVRAAFSYALGDNVENLTLTGSASIDGTGNALDNVIKGNNSNNVLRGGLGNDSLFGGNGFDTADYSDAASGVTVSLATSIAQNTGAAGIDTLSSIEKLIGSAFDDILTGGSSHTELNGGTGNDRFVSGTGATVMVGGLGSDTFVYLNLSQASVSTSKLDTIMDFSHLDGDRIDLSAIDANKWVKGDQAFFLGGSAFTGKSGELIQYQDGDEWRLEGDINGDSIADLAIAFRPIAQPLAAWDFVL